MRVVGIEKIGKSNSSRRLLTRVAICLTPAVVWLAECEVKRLNTGIKELNLKGSVPHRAPLANKLIEARLADLSGPVGERINSAIGSRRYPA